ncbi:hypothetical protein EMIHUDRAFT_197202 [Emiliania huxleyi CCMP1516]|uniref:SET domain-containing protein n=2 Tax=Emiliania huxleyi TaxID=2903 RepID=A0A0D3ITV7_EMIH1|nr:hypothetical protein EMIHUDRAFT_197202 [Emiliania huxleyi CCMP1516]EOD14692.1 hypothetical protein EMIHUDRAFT_197202 [Emiliania huxleyi CCMP1516]|eukprot:XP_005767121.1 hypothetical protein EMIHUDRAFT_197202 [Emiliania huxleyi CCMP1516]
MPTVRKLRISTRHLTEGQKVRILLPCKCRQGDRGHIAIVKVACPSMTFVWDEEDCALRLEERKQLTEALCNETKNGNSQRVADLLSQGAHAFGVERGKRSPMHEAATYAPCLIELLLGKGPLYFVCCALRDASEGDKATLIAGGRELLARSPDPRAEVSYAQKKGYTPLMEASESGSADLVEPMLEALAAAEALGEVDKQDKSGMSALHWAAQSAPDEEIEKTEARRPPRKPPPKRPHSALGGSALGRRVEARVGEGGGAGEARGAASEPGPSRARPTAQSKLVRRSSSPVVPRPALGEAQVREWHARAIHTLKRAGQGEALAALAKFLYDAEAAAPSLRELAGAGLLKPASVLHVLAGPPSKLVKGLAVEGKPNYPKIQKRDGAYERSLLLYQVSGPPTRLVYPPGCPAPEPEDEAALEAAASAASAAVSAELDKAAWPTATRQMVALWWARAARPHASAEAQLRVARGLFERGRFENVPGEFAQCSLVQQLRDVLVSLDPKVEIASAVGPGGQSVEPPLFVYASEQVSFDVLPPLPRKQKPVPAQLPGAAGVEKKLRLFLTKCSESSAVWGVQAAEDIRQDDFVCEYVGELISPEEEGRRTRLHERVGDYVFERGSASSDQFVDGFAVRNVGAFINFRCDPNLVVRPLKSYFDPDGRWCRFGFFAKKDIKEGDEVGYLRDPGATTRRKYSEKKCLCGATERGEVKCRGWL